MAKKLDRILYGERQDIAYSDFDIGKVLKAIAVDLQEYGQSGVQGVKIKSDYSKLVDKAKKGEAPKTHYFMGGTCASDLILVLRDTKNPKYEEWALLVPSYEKLRADLAAKTAAVVKLAADKDDPTIKAAAAARAGKFGTTIVEEDDASFGGITGDIILCAHGGAAANSRGRVIGTSLGRKSADDLVKFLTGQADKRKNIGKTYNGVIRLSGCFTGSGGPEAHEADEALAKKVWDKLKSAGYTKCSVVGIPGPAKWAAKDGADSAGTAMKKGDPHSSVEVLEKADLERFDAMIGEFEEIQAENAKLTKLFDELDAKHAAAAKKLAAAAQADKPVLQQILDKLNLGAAKVRTRGAANDKRMDELSKLSKRPEYAKLLKTQAKVEGRFGLRVLN